MRPAGLVFAIVLAGSGRAPGGRARLTRPTHLRARVPSPRVALRAASHADDGRLDASVAAHTGATPTAAQAATPIAAERELGTMENLFAPRRMRGHNTSSTPHVACLTLAARISDAQLAAAVQRAISTQPMLSRRIVGSGAPERHTRLGSLRAPGIIGSVLPFLSDEDMVRVGDPDPLRFAPMAREAAAQIHATAVSVRDVADDAALDAEWRGLFAAELNLERGDFNLADGPLWRLTALRSPARTALVFALNHAISDQASLNSMLAAMLAHADSEAACEALPEAAAARELPPPLEAAILGPKRSVGFFGEKSGGSGLLGLEHGTGSYLLAKLKESAAGELPRSTPPPWQRRSDPLLQSAARRSAPEFRVLEADAVTALRASCRAANVTVSFALAACAAAVAAELCQGTGASAASGDGLGDGGKMLKVLLSLDMRAFGSDAAGSGAPSLRSPERLSCQAGSMDLQLPCDVATAARLGTRGALRAGSGGGGAGASGAAARAAGGGRRAEAQADAAARRLWELARSAQAQLRSFTDANFPEMSVLVFDWAMRSFEMTRLVELEADNPLTLGRAYAASVSNVGALRDLGTAGGGGEAARGAPQGPAPASASARAGARGLAAAADGLYFAVPHARTGALLPFSAATVGGRMHLTLNAPSPLVDARARAHAADRMVDLLGALGAEAEAAKAVGLGQASGAVRARKLASAALALSSAALALPHVSAWGPWADAWGRVIAAGAMDADWAPLKFWAFFAAMHPLLQPALWISELLHGTPGPLLGGLVPLPFVLLNMAALAALSRSGAVRNGLNALLFAAFVGYIASGLDGAGSPSAYNLALDDGIRGCPAYEEVVQPSMRDFDVKKYQGRWYELGFHDWTQFSEVYGTTLDIELSQDGQRWVDDFAVKGPAPLVAPLSWDKSPVANGAHYFLYGKVDTARPGVLQESGFGLTFPNFIVDVQKDPKSGAYTQAIQFQCLERGGVRIFEGINFLSRTTDRQAEQMVEMHARATRAKMDPYGSSVEQMHVVEHSAPGAAPVDNAWQRMWEAVGLPKLLALAEGAMHSQAEDILNKVQ